MDGSFPMFSPPLTTKNGRLEAAFSYRIDLFFPYIGVTYADVKAHFEGEDVCSKTAARSRFGIGCDK